MDGEGSIQKIRIRVHDYNGDGGWVSGGIGPRYCLTGIGNPVVAGVWASDDDFSKSKSRKGSKESEDSTHNKRQADGVER